MKRLTPLIALFLVLGCGSGEHAHQGHDHDHGHDHEHENETGQPDPVEWAALTALDELVVKAEAASTNANHDALSGLINTLSQSAGAIDPGNAPAPLPDPLSFKFHLEELNGHLVRIQAPGISQEDLTRELGRVHGSVEQLLKSAGVGHTCAHGHDH